MDPMMGLAVGFSSLNILVLAALLVLYARIVSRSRAMYPLGLMLFALLLLAQNSMTVYSYLSMGPLFGVALLPYLSVISILEFGGLLALARVTLQP